MYARKQEFEQRWCHLSYLPTSSTTTNWIRRSVLHGPSFWFFGREECSPSGRNGKSARCKQIHANLYANGNAKEQQSSME
mmetsp:Transcript_26523/g.55655  ORF Transcript_26523/g.55655 Transcript_26523/m.55655 type:complete len:80 (-) Transcript_26523:1572-1811(-)